MNRSRTCWSTSPATAPTGQTSTGPSGSVEVTTRYEDPGSAQGWSRDLGGVVTQPVIVGDLVQERIPWFRGAAVTRWSPQGRPG